MIGTTISHYKILQKLGEGGMGIVYKAEDTKLKRIVALKFLPKGLEAHEPERARFRQEAQAASALNHPNICTIHDLQDYEGQQFIVMEYVDGVTLRNKIVVAIHESPLPVNDVITYAIQISEALQEAHSHGIVHRDVKPENIMINSKNQIKVMDFGLAKLKGSLKLTRTSSTVGTLAYMAPEQIQGGEVDARSDIFSFGIVIYEMLTGRLPFRGEHEAAMVYSIVNEEPEAIEKYEPDVSPLLANIVQRALEKDQNDRYQSASDMVIELRRAQKKTTKVSRGLTAEIPSAAPERAVSEAATPEKIVSKKPLKKIVWVGVGVVALLCIIAAVYLFILQEALQVTLNPDMTFRVLPIPFTQVGSPGLSQDGNWAAFPAADVNGKYDIYFMNTTSGESRRITTDTNLIIAITDISPDGSHIVYQKYDASTNLFDILIVSSFGGSSKKIVNGGFCPKWRPDGQRIGYLREKDLGSESGKAEFWTVKPNGSDNHRELIDSTSSESGYFTWSPDGRLICWIRHFSQQCRELVVHHLSTSKSRQLTSDNKEIMDVCWAPNDQLIFSSNRSGNFNLWMVPASGGSATQITKGAGPDHSVEISSDGSKLLHRQRQYIGHIWIAGTNGSNPHQITFDDVTLSRVSFTPDGREVLFRFVQPTGYQQGSFVYSIDRNGRNRKQLTSGEESVNNPIASPDGQWIIYSRYSLSNPIDSSMVYMISAKDPGTPKLVGKGVPIRWIDNKTFVSFDHSMQNTWLNNIKEGESQKFFEDSTWAIPLQGGKYVGYYDVRSGRRGGWLSSMPGVKDPNLPLPRMLPSGEYGEFDKSGKYYYWVKNSGELRRISIPSGKEEIIRGLFPGLNPSLSWLDISYDGKEIVYTDARISSKLVMIENLFK